MKEEIFTNDDIPVGEMGRIPEFYESLTDNPIRDIVQGKKNVYDNILRLVELQEITIEFPAATLDGFGVPIPATATVNYDHTVRSGIPIIEWYETDEERVFEAFVASLSQPNVGDSSYDMTYYNYELVNLTVKVRVYVYELLLKNKSKYS